ncbi:MAG: SPOR domain-containing protein [Erythrobacter sp.]
MARRYQGYTAKSSIGPKLGLFVSTAVASLALASCAAAAPPAETSFAKAQAALEDGKIDRAIQHAEAAVLADPRNSGYRALLGAAYLEAGRFESAATAFGEALDLGNDDSRTVLSYALAKIATGDNDAALAQLGAHQDRIPPADMGLALALAGQPDRGVQYLINTVRQGENSAKARQNLAYAYALGGNWPAARVMAAEDVPADQLEARLADWAAYARPEDYQVRVAKLLNVEAVYDSGQPQHLALANFPEMATMVAEAEQQFEAEPVEVAEARPTEGEAMVFGVENVDTDVQAAPAVATVEPETARFVSNPVVQNVGGSEAPARTPTRVAQASAPAAAASAVPTPAPARMSAVAATTSSGATRFVSNAVVQNIPARAEREAPTRAAAPAPQQRRMAVATGSAATHLVQLGSFNSREVAEAKWGEFKRRFPELAGRDVVITEAEVNGRTYFRVAAAGFGSRSARSMCNTVKAGGVGCFAYAASSPPAGAVDRGVRIAARTR